MSAWALARRPFAIGGAPAVALAVIVIFTSIAVLAPFLTPYDPLSGSLINSRLPPFWMEEGTFAHPLGTDLLGRDVWCRIVYGARASLAVSLIAIFIAGSVGTFLGLISGYFGGWYDILIMRAVDLMLSMPLLLMALVLAVTLGPSFSNVIVVLVLSLWAQYARQIRNETLMWRERDFVKLARVAGASHLRIMWRHLLPNVLNTLIVLVVLQVGRVILLEASLSFLGVGLPPPQPAWGLMVAEGREFLHSAWWVSLMPGLAIVSTITALNVFGDWLRDYLDPKLTQGAAL
jgi:peptide/nickel transport system permease protein